MNNKEKLKLYESAIKILKKYTKLSGLEICEEGCNGIVSFINDRICDEAEQDIVRKAFDEKTN